MNTVDYSFRTRPRDAERREQGDALPDGRIRHFGFAEHLHIRRVGARAIEASPPGQLKP